MIALLRRLARPIFGEFEPEEFKKFLRMGAIFTCMIATYSSMSPLKNSIFCTFIGSGQIPYVKTISLLLIAPLIVVYTKLLDIFKRDKLFYFLSTIYIVFAFLFAVYYFAATGQAITTDLESISTFKYWETIILNYGFYIWVESYAALLIALFWAISTDVTSPESAEKGFPFVVAIGQVGGIFGPYLIAGLPHLLDHATNTLSIIIVAGLMFSSIFLLKNFFRKTPARLLISYRGTNEPTKKKKQDPGFFEGLRLVISSPYLIGIFAVVAFPEIITTIIDLHFNSLASQEYTGPALAHFNAIYQSSVNSVTLFFLLCGSGKITRFFGLGISLILMPIMYASAVLGFATLNSLYFLFVLMVGSKAANYALNGPAIKQLYIPTTQDVRYKAQPWIEIFGFRGSKVMGSGFGMLLNPLQNQLGQVVGRAKHALLASYLSCGIIFAWFFVALFLGRKHRKAIDQKEVVC